MMNKLMNLRIVRVIKDRFNRHAERETSEMYQLFLTKLYIEYMEKQDRYNAKQIATKEMWLSPMRSIVQSSKYYAAILFVLFLTSCVFCLVYAEQHAFLKLKCLLSGFSWNVLSIFILISILWKAFECLSIRLAIHKNKKLSVIADRYALSGKIRLIATVIFGFVFGCLNTPLLLEFSLVAYSWDLYFLSCIIVIAAFIEIGVTVSMIDISCARKCMNNALQECQMKHYVINCLLQE